MSCDRVVVVLALCIAGVAGFQSCENRDARAALARITQTADSLEVAHAQDREREARQRQADADSIAALERQIRGLRASYNRAQRTTDSLLSDSLLGRIVPDSGSGSPNDSLLGIARALRVAIATERAEARAIITAQDSVIATLRRGIAWRDDALNAKDAQLALQQRLLREALAAKRPGRIGCVVGAGAAVGWGHGAGAAVTCGVRL